MKGSSSNRPVFALLKSIPLLKTHSDSLTAYNQGEVNKFNSLIYQQMQK